MEKLRKVCVLD